MATQRVETWTSKGAKLVRYGRASRGSAQRLVKSTTIHVNVHVGPGNPPIPFPTYTDYPLVQWSTLDTSYYLRNLNNWSELPNMSDVLRSLTSRAYVELPPGFRGKIVDFKSGGTTIGCFAPNCMGLWGHGPDKAVIRLEPGSSTVAASVPLQNSGSTNPFLLMRLGPSNSSVSAAVHNYGFALFGTDQPNQPAAIDPNTGSAMSGSWAHPHNYQGLQNNQQSGGTEEWLVIGGVQGDWGAPPGETEAHTFYRSKAACFMRYCTVTGYQERSIAQGGAPTDWTADYSTRVGASAGAFGAESPTYENCEFSDSYVSGAPDIAAAGGATGTLSHNATFRYCRTNMNANHIVPNPGGKTFRAANHEGVYGTVYYDHHDFGHLDNEPTLQMAHVFIGNTQTDAPDFTIFEPTWDRSPGSFVPATNGAFLVQIPATYAGAANRQTSVPTVIKNGVTLTPVTRATNAGWPSGVNPVTQFILMK